MAMEKFLTFETFITPTLLILIYYVGAVIIPVLGWYFTFWVKKAYLSDISQSVKDRTTLKQRFVLSMIFFMTLLCMEIIWRVMFEFFIAYFDMHDALMKLMGTSNNR